MVRRGEIENVLKNSSFKNTLVWSALIVGVYTNSIEAASSFPDPKKIDPITAEEKKHALEFKRFRLSQVNRFSRGKRPRVRLLGGGYVFPESSLMPECNNHLKSIFCEFAVAAIPTSDSDSPEKKKSKPWESQKIRGLITQGNLTALKVYNYDQLIGAAKSMRDTDSLMPLIRAASLADDCALSPVWTVLGQKLEMGFPEPKYRELAEKMYSKSFECNNDSESLKAGYRLGLLKIWDKDYKKAEQIFTRVASGADTADYKIRAGYWRGFSQSKQGKKSDFQESQKALIKEFPLSIHALFASGVDDPVDYNILKPGRVEGLARSSFKPKLNSAVRAAEIFTLLGEKELAGEFLFSIVDELKGSESEFQFYVAKFVGDVHSGIAKFQVLASLVREKPEFLNHSVLEEMYPLERLDEATRFGSGMDPYMLLALMRQESAFQARARSRVGAVGLMQLMPYTAKKIERISTSSLYNPDINVRIGSKYFKQLVDRFSGDVDLALASYNAGPERVDEWKKRYPVEDRLLFLDLIPFKETREYVSSIARNYYWYVRIYQLSRLKEKVNLGKEMTRNPAQAAAPKFKVFEHKRD